MQTTARERGRSKASPELAHILSLSAAAVIVLALGAGIAALLPDPSVWQVASAFLAPAGLAFLIHWWNAQER
jgi:hypothetical protein